MLSYSTIEDIVRQNTLEAKLFDKRPLPVTADLCNVLVAGDRPDESIPFLGNYVPRGWTPTEKTFFVDSSGAGLESEPALTTRSFGAALRKYADSGFGIGVIEAGQFQVIVRLYKKQ